MKNTAFINKIYSNPTNNINNIGADKRVNIKGIFILSLALVLTVTLLFFAPDIRFAEASSAECMITIESSTNRVLYGHNEHKKRPMASVTKILTAITVLENCLDLEKKVTVPKEAVGVEGSSIYLQAGEKISTLDLLYGLMLQSGNDSAVTLAVTTAGSIEKFADLMNKTAKKAGAKNSNFVNPHGLHDDNHYTTAYDLAVITSYAMKNDVFKEVASCKLRKIERTNPEAPTSIVSKNRLLFSYDGADGVKTGFTKKAGRCLVASATRDGMQVISVVLNCGPMFEDCAALMSRAFSEYRLTKIAAAGEYLAEVAVTDGKFTTVKGGVCTDIYYPLKKGETLITEVKIDSPLFAPFKKGYKLGDISFKLNNRLLFTQELFSIEDAPSMSYGKFLKRVITEW